MTSFREKVCEILRPPYLTPLSLSLSPCLSDSADALSNDLIAAGLLEMKNIVVGEL